MRTTLRVIDFISAWTGRLISPLCVALVLVLCYEVTVRYAFNAPTMWAHELSMMMGGTIIVLGLAYTHHHDKHVRIDVLYMHLSPRGKAINDIICALIFLFPLLIVLTITAVDWMQFSWKMGEVSIFSHWYPPAGPSRTIVLVGFSLFALQGAARFIRDSYLLIRNKTYD